jgi:hypothetical protein
MQIPIFDLGTKILNKFSTASPAASNQGCQMVCFQTKNPNLGKLWRVLQWKIMVYFMDTWSILRSFVIHTYFMDIWYSSW